jgi:hypothetical protein
MFLEQVYKRLKLTLELVKKEMEISKLQVIIFLSSGPANGSLAEFFRWL